jgi:tetratricopeptide (TPR) repeat protein
MKEHRIQYTVNGGKTFIGFILLVFLTGSSLCADSFRKEISKGNEAYRGKNYDRAAGHYRSAEIDQPGSPVATYNLGTALVGGKNYEEALRKLAEASEKMTGLEKSKAHYNIGNGLFGAEKYQDAIGAYKKALEINPFDRDAKYNLELALRKLREQQQQKKNQKQDKNDQNQKDEKGSSSDSDPTKQDQKHEQREQNQQAKSDDKQGKEKPKPAQPKQQMTKEEAERILAALKNEEMKAKKDKKTQGIPVRGGKDW